MAFCGLPPSWLITRFWSWLLRKVANWLGGTERVGERDLLVERSQAAINQRLDEVVRQVEIERQVEFVSLQVFRVDLGRVPYLSDSDRLGIDPLIEGAEIFPKCVGGGGIDLVCPLFDHVLGGVQAEAIHTDLFQPEAHHVLHFCHHLGIGVVQVGKVG